MSSEPSERAKAWFDAKYHAKYTGYVLELRAYDAGYSEGEKKGTAVGCLKALREVREHLANWRYTSKEQVIAELDRRIREAEENAK